MRFEVLTVVLLKFQDVTTGHWVRGYKQFEGSQCLHLL